MKVTLEAGEVWDHLKKCKVGDRKVVEFTVTGKGPEEVRGDATHADYAEGEEEGEDYEGESMHNKKSRGMPKAIVMVSED